VFFRPYRFYIYLILRKFYIMILYTCTTLIEYVLFLILGSYYNLLL